jgi:hypothetical protein
MLIINTYTHYVISFPEMSAPASPEYENLYSIFYLLWRRKLFKIMSVLFNNNINNLCVHISYTIFALFGGSITNVGNKKHGIQTPLRQDFATGQTAKLVQTKSHYVRSLCQLT